MPGTRSSCLQSFNLPLAPYLPPRKKPQETMGLGTQQLLMEEGDMGLEQKKLQALLAPLVFSSKEERFPFKSMLISQIFFISRQKLLMEKGDMGLQQRELQTLLTPLIFSSKEKRFPSESLLISQDIFYRPPAMPVQKMNQMQN